MGYAVPAQAEVQGEPAVYAPVILDVHGPRNVVPVTVILHGEFVVALGSPQEEIGKVIASFGFATTRWWIDWRARSCSKRPVKVEGPLGRTEQVLNLLIDRPTRAELELVRSLGERYVVADLVIVSLVLPRPARDFKMGVNPAVQIDIRDAVRIIRTGEEPGIRGDVTARESQASQTGTRKGDDVDAVAVVVKGSLVNQRRTDRIGS